MFRRKLCHGINNLVPHFHISHSVQLTAFFHHSLSRRPQPTEKMRLFSESPSDSSGTNLPSSPQTPTSSSGIFSTQSDTTSVASSSSHPASSPYISSLIDQLGSTYDQLSTNIPDDPIVVGVLSALAGVGLTLGGIKGYRRYWRRIKNSNDVTGKILDEKRWIKGVVTSVGDGGEFDGPKRGIVIYVQTTSGYSTRLDRSIPCR